MAIPLNFISNLPKWRSPKSLLLLHFAINLFETFRINVNEDFANKRIFGPKIQKLQKSILKLIY